MARRTDRLDLHEKGIAVTIEKQVLELQACDRRSHPFPIRSGANGSRVHRLRLDGLLQCLLVHEGHHQHRAITPILHDRRNQPLRIEFQLPYIHYRTATPF